MNITLIGMAGAGKTSIGKELANKMKAKTKFSYKLIDTDELIEKKEGMKLQQIIDTRGDNEFLKLEEKTILKLGSKINNSIIAPGGSVVYCPEAMTFLKQNSEVVFLDSDLAPLLKRVKNKEERGIVGLKEKSFEQLFKERLIMYRRYADLSIRMSENPTAGRIANEIIRKLNE